jgi:hypothetical protein
LKPGQSLQIVTNPPKSLSGRLEYGFGEQFSSFLLSFSVTERERRANRAVAQRRAKEKRQRKLAPEVTRPQPAKQPLTSFSTGHRSCGRTEKITRRSPFHGFDMKRRSPPCHLADEVVSSLF